MRERRCLLVRNGIAKDVFTPVAAPPVRGDEPLRILIEGNPGVWFKGVGEAQAGLRHREAGGGALDEGARMGASAFSRMVGSSLSS